MIDILVTWNNKPDMQIEILTVAEFYQRFNIKSEMVVNMEEWQGFLIANGLPPDYVPNYENSGFSLQQMKELDLYGYVVDTDCYSFDCYFYNGDIYATPYLNHLSTGEHITNAFQKLCGAIECTQDCNIFWR